jgi:hypothetical protein
MITVAMCQLRPAPTVKYGHVSIVTVHSSVVEKKKLISVICISLLVLHNFFRIMVYYYKDRICLGHLLATSLTQNFAKLNFTLAVSFKVAIILRHLELEHNQYHFCINKIFPAPVTGHTITACVCFTICCLLLFHDLSFSLTKSGSWESWRGAT